MSTTEIPSPDIYHKPIKLNLRGDVGFLTAHKTMGWICSQILSHVPVGSDIAIWNDPNGKNEGAKAVSEGIYDAAFHYPVCCTPMALDGRGSYATSALSPMIANAKDAGASYPKLRALGTVPQYDRLVVALRRDTGITSFAEWRKKKAGLRIACPLGHASNWVGWGARRLLQAEGIPESTLNEWGGGFVEFPQFPEFSFRRAHPGMFVNLATSGGADGVIEEAIMVSQWHDDAVKDLVFLPVEEEAFEEMERECGWPRATVPAGYFPGQDDAFDTLEFSDFHVIVSEEMRDDIAYLMAWIMGETHFLLQMEYAHIPPEQSTLSYPLSPEVMCKPAIPLHPGAQRYWDLKLG